MQNIRPIIEAYSDAKAAGKRMALATVVQVIGSAYRRPGARMLIIEDERTIGSISGGCLERDLALRAQKVIEDNAPALFQYSTSGSDDDIVFGVGAGCNGRVDILVEPVKKFGSIDPLLLLDQTARQRERSVLVTIVSAADSVSARVGDKYHFTADAQFTSSLNYVAPQYDGALNYVAPQCDGALIAPQHDGALNYVGPQCDGALIDVAPQRDSSLIDVAPQCDGSLNESALRDELRRSALAVINSGRSEFSAFDNDRIEAFVELLEPPIQLIMCGNGQDATPMVEIAAALGWQIVVLGSHFDPGAALTELICADRIAVVIMNHNYATDLRFLRTSVASDAGYIGLLGPKHRSQKLMQELLAGGVPITEQQRARIYSPVGLDIGGDSEAEVALSVISEIQSVLHARPAGFLRDRIGSIHQNDGAHPPEPLDAEAPRRQCQM